MTTPNLVSVVLAVHDGAPTLDATLDSILGQQDVDLELIVVDDGSTDATSQILARYGERLRVMRNPENRGLTQSLIIGCEAARGEFIARHDAGDVSLPMRLARQRALFASRPELALASCWTEYVGPELEPLFVAKGTEAAAAGPIDIIDLTRPNGVSDGPTHHGAAMFRAGAYRAAGGYRSEFRFSQDWDLWFRIAERGRFQIVPEVLYRARITPGSISTNARATQHALGALAVEALRVRQRGESDAPILARAATLSRTASASKPSSRAAGLYFIGEALRRNRDTRARKYLLEAARARLIDIRPWVRWLQSLVTTRRP